MTYPEKQLKIAYKLFLLLIMLVLFCILMGNIAFAGEVNPYRQEVLQIERIANLIDRPGARALYTYSAEYVLLTQKKSPALGEKAAWQIDCSGKTDSTIADMKCYLFTKDYSTEYTTVYRKEGIVSRFTTCTLLSAGDYRIIIYVTFSDDTNYYNYIDFTLEDDAQHTSLSEKITEVVAECKASTQWRTALNLHDWLTTHAYYDHNLEYYGADGVLLRGYGVCDSYAKAYQMLCTKAGITVGRVEGIANGGSHAWNAIRISGEWYHVDPTWDDPGSAATAVSGAEGHNYFCLNDDLISLDHKTYDKEDFSQNWTSLDANYDVKLKNWEKLGNDFYENGVWTNYIQKIQSIAITGQSSFTLQGDSKVITSHDGTYYSYCFASENDGIRCWTKLAWLLSKEEYPYGNESLSISVSYNKNDRIFACKLNGYVFEEIGILTLPASLKIIEEETFAQSIATTVIIPNGCSSIQSKALANSGVRMVYVPNSVKSIADDAFEGCGAIAFVCDAGSSAAKYAAAHGIMRVDP